MKSDILRYLKENRAGYVSGEELSRLLGVSRTAVWKHVRELKEEGYVIESSSKKGYKLESIPDILDPYEIAGGLETETVGKEIICLDTVDSTNNYAKRAALEGCMDGTVITAECQTAGRGRLGREWSTTGKKGIWMSVVLRPEISPEEVQIITLAASVAVVSAIRHTTGIDTGIKWPNDIILEGRKVCGILTEMNSEMERVNFLVLGIGINVNQDTCDFSESLLDKAVSLRMSGKGRVSSEDTYTAGNFNRNGIINRILFELDKNYSKINKGFTSHVIEEWKKNSVTIGKEVRIISRDSEYTGMAKDLTGDGKLVVDCTDGLTREITSGEISVRGVMGYS